MIGLPRIGWRCPVPGSLPRSVGPRGFRVLLIVATGFLVVAALYTSALIMERQQSLYAVSRYNASWLLSQAGVEVARHREG